MTCINIQFISSLTFLIYLMCCVCVFFVFCYIPLANTSNTMSNKSDDSGLPCPVPDFWEKAFNISLLVVLCKNTFIRTFHS